MTVNADSYYMSVMVILSIEMAQSLHYPEEGFMLCNRYKHCPVLNSEDMTSSKQGAQNAHVCFGVM